MNLVLKSKFSKVFISIIFALSFTTTAFAVERSDSFTDQDTKGVIGYATESANLDMQRITVRPTYKDSLGNLKTASGYYYDRTGNFPNSISITVSASDQTNLKQNVERLGYKQVGYQISVKYVMTGNFTNGRVISTYPSIPIKRVSPGLVNETVFYTTLDDPELIWDVSFHFSSNRSLWMDAAARFAK